MSKLRVLILLLLVCALPAISTAQTNSLLSETYRRGDFRLVHAGLGRVKNSVFIKPTTAASIEPARVLTQSPSLSYDLQLISSGEVKVIMYLILTQPLKAGSGLRLAVGFDDQPPKIMTVGAGVEVSSTEWSFNVLNATAIGTATLKVSRPGKSVFNLYMIDSGVVVDRVVLDLGGLKPSYLGPPETSVR